MDARELQNVFNLIGEPMTPNQIHEVMTVADTDGSGDVDFRELVRMLSRRKKLCVAEDEILEAFATLVKHSASVREEGFETSAVISRQGLLHSLNAMEIPEMTDQDMDSVVTNMLTFAAANNETAQHQAHDDAGLNFETFRKLMLHLGELLDALPAQDGGAIPDEWQQATCFTQLASHTQNPVGHAVGEGPGARIDFDSAERF